MKIKKIIIKNKVVAFKILFFWRALYQKSKKGKFAAGGGAAPRPRPHTKFRLTIDRRVAPPFVPCLLHSPPPFEKKRYFWLYF